MPLKDHPIVILITTCAVTSGAAWTASENIRVNPLQAKIASLNEKIQEQKSNQVDSPKIREITLTKHIQGRSRLVDQNIYYQDPNGDATFLNWIVIQTNANSIEVTSRTLTSSSEEQKSGAYTKGQWNCGNENYFVKLEAVITDRSGNVSTPYNYTIDCNF